MNTRGLRTVLGLCLFGTSCAPGGPRNMLVRFPEIVVGAAKRHGNLTVLPLYAPSRSQVDYDLARDAIDRRAVDIREVHQSGSVGALSAFNHGERSVLFLEGEHLLGVKQNRIINASLLLGARASVVLPVSCVERGRWQHRSDNARAASAAAPARLRRVIKASVTCALRSRRGHVATQAGVWSEIDDQQRDLRVASPTGAMADGFAAHDREIQSYERALPYSTGAAGLALGIGRTLVSVDLFDKPNTCAAFWPRLLSGAALDALRTPSAPGEVDAFHVQYVMTDLRRSTWHRAPAVAQGEEYRTSTGRGLDASILSFRDELVHYSVVGGEEVR